MFNFCLFIFTIFANKLSFEGFFCQDSGIIEAISLSHKLYSIDIASLYQNLYNILPNSQLFEALTTKPKCDVFFSLTEQNSTWRVLPKEA